jgi:hypothetical protein
MALALAVLLVQHGNDRPVRKNKQAVFTRFHLKLTVRGECCFCQLLSFPLV